ncbi:MAG: tetratricopeptide repeat protein [Candidatus Obscuribacterales bacterium]
MDTKENLLLTCSLVVAVLAHPLSTLAADWKDKPSWDKASEAGVSALEKGQFLKAEQSLKTALKIARTNGGSNEYIATSIGNLAAAENALGKAKEAEALFKESIAMLEKDSKLKSDLYSTLSNLAVCYSDNGRPTEAAKVYQRLVTAMSKDPKVNPLETARYLDLLVEIEQSQGHLTAALPFCAQSLALKEKARVPDEVLVNALSRLANLNYFLGRYKEAETINKRALAIDQKRSNFVSAASAHNNLAMIYTAQGRYNEAEAAFKRCLPVFENGSGDKEQLAETLTNFGNLYMDKEQPELAEPLYQRELKIQENRFGATDARIKGDLSNLANCYRHQGKLAKAEPLFVRALALSNKAGENDFQKAPLMNNLALLYVSQGNYGKAEPLYKRSIAAQEKALGRSHPDVMRTIGNYAVMLDKTNRHAESLLLRAPAKPTKKLNQP